MTPTENQNQCQHAWMSLGMGRKFWLTETTTEAQAYREYQCIHCGTKRTEPTGPITSTTRPIVTREAV